jgi:hypothetical protein
MAQPVLSCAADEPDDEYPEMSNLIPTFADEKKPQAGARGRQVGPAKTQDSHVTIALALLHPPGRRLRVRAHLCVTFNSLLAS